MIRLIAIAWLAMVGTGCQIRPPKLPRPLIVPKAQVTQVGLRDASAEASRYDVFVKLQNANDFALPMTHAEYRFVAGDQVYIGDVIPNATIPAGGEMTVKLPAVVAGAVGGPYQVSGSIQVSPPGQIRQIMYELGVPLPRASFAGAGSVEPMSAPADEPSQPLSTAPPPSP